jgi:ketosteroid isomerase-like protein
MIAVNDQTTTTTTTTTMVPPPEAFRALIQDFARRLESGDTAGLACDFYAEGARLVPPAYYAIIGRDPIRRFLQSMVDEGLYRVQFEVTGIEAAHAAVYALGRFELEVSREAGPPARETGMWLVLFRRQRDGAWQAVEQVFHGD